MCRKEALKVKDTLPPTGQTAHALGFAAAAGVYVCMRMHASVHNVHEINLIVPVLVQEETRLLNMFSIKNEIKNMKQNLRLLRKSYTARRKLGQMLSDPHVLYGAALVHLVSQGG